MDWNTFKPYFTEKDNWGNPAKVLWHHIHHLWMIRTGLLKNQGHDWPMALHCSYESTGHAVKSFHSRGGVSIATDYHFDTNVSFKKQIIILNNELVNLGLAEFCGLGVYPNWTILATGKPVPGFHFDSRGHKSRWGHIDGDYEYDMWKVKVYIENKFRL